MRVHLTWFATGNVTVFEDDNAILGPQTTILELKGLIQIRFGFDASLIVIVYNKHVLDNHVTLRSLGITDDASAAAKPLLAHAFSENDLDDDDRTSTEDDAKIHEFSHEDFAKLTAMLGKSEAVSQTRIEEVRHAGAPLSRPRFLDKQPDGPLPTAADPSAPSSQGVIAPGSVPVERILRTLMHGMRFPTAEADFAVAYPGQAEPMGFWDLRCAEHPIANVPPGDVGLELFFFGEFTYVKNDEMCAIIRNMLESKGYRCDVRGPSREAGCMYPLIAVPVVMSEAEARHLGESVFEGFGRMPPAVGAGHADTDPGIARVAGGAGAQPNCTVQ